MDERISGLFQEWLSAFKRAQQASGNEVLVNAHKALTEIETRIATTPTEGLQGLAIKLGLHCFLNEHSDGATTQSDSAYRDLVRLTGRDPVAEIAAFQRE